MDIGECANCGARVLPMPDGSCPSCGSPFAEAVSRFTWSVKVFWPFLRRETGQRRFLGHCKLTLSEDGVSIERKHPDGSGPRLDSDWSGVALVKNRIREKGRLTLRIRETDLPMKVVDGDVDQLARLLESEALSVDAQRKRLAEELRCLPALPFKKARLIDRDFRLWLWFVSGWVFFGAYGVLDSIHSAFWYPKFVALLRSSSVTSMSSDPEVAAFLAQLKPHVEILERFVLLVCLDAMLAVPLWCLLFFAWKGLTARQPTGPKFLMIYFGVHLVLNALGALMTLSVPWSYDLRNGFTHLIFQVRFSPVLALIPLLAAASLLGKRTRIYYQYTVLQPGCFKKGGIGLELLKEREKESEETEFDIGKESA